MKTSIKNILSSLLVIWSAFAVNAQSNVALNDANLHYDGAFYTIATPTLVTFNRHSSTVINDPSSGIYGSWIQQWVITETGIRIRFKTSSPSIHMKFKQRTGGGTIGSTPTNGFAVYADSVYLTSYSSLDFVISNPHPGTATFFEVVLPDLWAVDFIQMDLATGYVLANADFAVNKPVYVSFGDSITHGTGQYVSSAKTYPFVLAKENGWDLYNIAVAGSTLGWSMALNIKGKHVDVITILIGFNDWKYTSDALSVKQQQYEMLVDSVRKYQPTAMIFCITPLITTDNNGAAPYSIQEFRDMVSSVVTSRMQADNKLFLVSGPAISNSGMLAPGDAVHLSEPGAATLASNLGYVMANPSVLTDVQVSSNTTEEKGIVIERMNESELVLKVSEADVYSVGVFTLDGKEVYRVNDLFLEKGSSVISWNDTLQQTSSVYVVRVQNQKVSEGVVVRVSK